MKTIAAVIPVHDTEKLHGLLECVVRNTMHPTHIILINNTGREGGVIVPVLLPNTKIEIYEPSSPMGINASWKKGFALARECNLIAVLRNDILIGYDFFQKARQASNQIPMASVYCPTVETDPKRLNKFMFEAASCSKMKDPTDTAFVLRSEFLQDLPTIPSELTTYHGADWIFLWTSQIWRRNWIQINNALAFRQIVPIVNSDNEKVLQREEREIFERLTEDL